MLEITVLNRTFPWYHQGYMLYLGRCTWCAFNELLKSKHVIQMCSLNDFKRCTIFMIPSEGTEDVL